MKKLVLVSLSSLIFITTSFAFGEIFDTFGASQQMMNNVNENELRNQELQQQNILNKNALINASRSDFCEGFQRGYISGYKQAHNTNINPIAPICPIQPIKSFGDPESDYEHGYTIGYEKGIQGNIR